MPSHFTPETMRFLRGLAKHNERTWFEARRATYERHLKEPLHALVEEINGALADFAPEHIRPPQKVAMRIYRDTRFSPNKRPYKTHLAAWWARQGLEKTDAAGFFLQIAPEGSLVAAGVYAPERDSLLLLRRWMADHHARYRERFHELMRPAKSGLAFEAISPNALTRNPKGFPPDHPAGELLRARNWGVLTHLPGEAALQPDFAKEIVKRFRVAAPLVSLLNEPFLISRRPQAIYPL
jgi:uncharacterized protein (TIGR02453 family)